MGNYDDEIGYFDINKVPNRLSSDLFKTFLGGEFDFYGVDNESFCLGSNGSRMVLEAVENPDDGYRSYFGCFRTAEVGKIFFGSPIARVVLEEGGMSTRTWCGRWDGNGDELPPKEEDIIKMRQNFSGWVLRDVNTGHILLTVGTDHGDDYYPCFTFRYEPDPSRKI